MKAFQSRSHLLIGLSDLWQNGVVQEKIFYSSKVFGAVSCDIIAFAVFQKPFYY